MISTMACQQGGLRMDVRLSDDMVIVPLKLCEKKNHGDRHLLIIVITDDYIVKFVCQTYITYEYASVPEYQTLIKLTNNWSSVDFTTIAFEHELLKKVLQSICPEKINTWISVEKYV